MTSKTTPAISTASILKALKDLDQTDAASLRDFVEKIEKSVTAKVTRPPTVTAGEVNERDVFQLFGLSNPYTDFGTIRNYHYREMKAKPPSSILSLPSGSAELLRSVAETWPLNNESNVRVFISMIIHYAVHQINTERAASQTSSDKPTSSNSSCLAPSPTAPLPVTPLPPQNSNQSSAVPNTPITLKAYTEVPASAEIIDSNNQRISVRGIIDFGISYAAPNALHSFFAVFEAKAVGKLDNQAWAQLLCYLGPSTVFSLSLCTHPCLAIIKTRREAAEKSNVTVFGCLTDGGSYQFAKVSNTARVFHGPATQKLSVMTDYHRSREADFSTSLLSLLRYTGSSLNVYEASFVPHPRLPRPTKAGFPVR